MTTFDPKKYEEEISKPVQTPIGGLLEYLGWPKERLMEVLTNPNMGKLMAKEMGAYVPQPKEELEAENAILGTVGGFLGGMVPYETSLRGMIEQIGPVYKGHGSKLKQLEPYPVWERGGGEGRGVVSKAGNPKGMTTAAAFGKSEGGAGGYSSGVREVGRDYQLEALRRAKEKIPSVFEKDYKDVLDEIANDLRNYKTVTDDGRNTLMFVVEDLHRGHYDLAKTDIKNAISNLEGSPGTEKDIEILSGLYEKIKEPRGLAKDFEDAVEAFKLEDSKATVRHAQAYFPIAMNSYYKDAPTMFDATISGLKTNANISFSPTYKANALHDVKVFEDLKSKISSRLPKDRPKPDAYLYEMTLFKGKENPPILDWDKPVKPEYIKMIRSQAEKEGIPEDILDSMGLFQRADIDKTIEGLQKELDDVEKNIRIYKIHKDPIPIDLNKKRLDMKLRLQNLQSTYSDLPSSPKGREVYSGIGKYFGDQVDASNFLNRAGFGGHQFPVGTLSHGNWRIEERAPEFDITSAVDEAKKQGKFKSIIDTVYEESKKHGNIYDVIGHKGTVVKTFQGKNARKQAEAYVEAKQPKNYVNYNPKDVTVEKVYDYEGKEIPLSEILTWLEKQGPM